MDLNAEAQAYREHFTAYPELFLETINDSRVDWRVDMREFDADADADPASVLTGYAIDEATARANARSCYECELEETYRLE